MRRWSTRPCWWYHPRRRPKAPSSQALVGPSCCQASAVSYGSSPRDSLTISSREGDRLWAALQRELVTLGGQVVERQEFPLPLGPDGRAMSDLAVAGALLLLGVPPEELEGEDRGERL